MEDALRDNNAPGTGGGLMSMKADHHTGDMM